MTLQLGGGVPVLLEVTCRFWTLEVALPGFGFVTSTENVPADGALPMAVSCVDDRNVVANGEPTKST